MGKCSNCGNQALVLKKKECLSCGKECCEKCASTVITIGHPGQRRFAADEKWACSAECKRKFEEQVLDYPLEDLGTDRGIESDCIRNELWYKAVLSALNKNDLVWKVRNQKIIRSQRFG